MNHELICADWLDAASVIPDNYFDLVICSPPYEDARTYGIDFKAEGQEWVDWAIPRYLECVRVCKGLVVWVVEGRTKDFRYSAAPLLLMADLCRAGVNLRKPPIYYRQGIPGSGGPDWWKNNYEFCIASTKGRLPWSDPTACGEPPKYAPGGDPSHRTQDGTRVSVKQGTPRRPTGKREVQKYVPPKLANPGNVIMCKVGGGQMGHPIAHENEAPFPESLVYPFMLSFCPLGGKVLDCFLGSGTTLAVAEKTGRECVGVDIRQSEIDKATRRLESIRVSSQHSNRSEGKTSLFEG